tara:strand:- start:67 stop:354 length:288 start_codon:yes stop_codon:yes gene_type:complete
MRKIPKGVREQVWIQYNGTEFFGKCFVPWCKNIISVFTYSVGHNKPRSKGGSNTIDNLRPICCRCNTSMGNRYTIDEWIEKYNNEQSRTCGCWPF